MIELRIEPARVEDLPAIRELAALIWHAHYPGIISREQINYMLARMYALETLRDEVLSQGIRYDLAWLGNTRVGYASYGPTDEPKQWMLHKLYLLPEHHGHGIGSAFLKHCEQRARSQGAEELILNVNKQNTKAIAAYQRNGYAIAESVAVDIGGGFVMDDFVMTKRL